MRQLCGSVVLVQPAMRPPSPPKFNIDCVAFCASVLGVGQELSALSRIVGEIANMAADGDDGVSNKDQDVDQTDDIVELKDSYTIEGKAIKPRHINFIHLP